MYKFTDFQKSGWVIIGRRSPHCVWCERAMERLDRLKAHYIVRYYDDHAVLRDFLLQQELPTVPQIYHRGMHVGGFDKLENYIRSLGE